MRPRGFDWRVALRYGFIILLPFMLGIPGLIALIGNPNLAYFWADTKDYMAAASDILRHGFSVILKSYPHPDLPDHVLWFDRPPVYPLILLVVDLIPGPFEIWHFTINCLFKGLAGLVIYRLLKREVGQGWLGLLILYSYMVVFPIFILSDITFLMATALFAVSGMRFLDSPDWRKTLALSGAGILMAFTKPTGMFIGFILMAIGLFGKRTRAYSLLGMAIMGLPVLLWCWRNQNLYGRFAFSQIPDVNTAFFLSSALYAQQTGQEKAWGFGWGYMSQYALARDTYKRRVKELGIENDDRAKAALISDMAKQGREMIMNDLAGYALCHLKYTTRFFLPKGFFSSMLQDFTDSLVKILVLLLSAVGFAFWWKRMRLKAAFLSVGALWFLLTPGPVMDERVVAPFYVFSAIMAQGGWVLWIRKHSQKA
ncbi:MAG: hypothetical protein ABIN66_04165 [candidate division WOR-3 bacterium]